MLLTMMETTYVLDDGRLAMIWLLAEHESIAHTKKNEIEIKQYVFQI